MDAFVINLSSAENRWRHIEKVFTGTPFSLVRVEAVHGLTTDESPATYAEASFARRHGRSTNLREVACYQSHLQALRMFLASAQEHALICEDDVAFRADAVAAICRLLGFAQFWDIARLSGLKESTGINAFSLSGGYSLRVNLGRLKGAGAYVINRRAAEKMSRHLLPMRVPFDHAIDREWFYGLTAVSVSPFPVDQTSARFFFPRLVGQPLGLACALACPRQGVTVASSLTDSSNRASRLNLET